MREELWEQRYSPKNTTQCPKPRFKPRPLNSESSARAMRPLRLQSTLLNLNFIIFFIVRRCEYLLPPANGAIMGQCLTEYSSVCRMQCYVGYQAVGSEERRCDVSPNNVMIWTGSSLQCVRDFTKRYTQIPNTAYKLFNHFLDSPFISPMGSNFSERSTIDPKQSMPSIFWVKFSVKELYKNRKEDMKN